MKSRPQWSGEGHYRRNRQVGPVPRFPVHPQREDPQSGYFECPLAYFQSVIARFVYQSTVGPKMAKVNIVAFTMGFVRNIAFC